MKLLQITCLSSLLLFSPTLFAKQATNQQVDTLIQVLNISELLKATFQQVRPQMDQQAYAIVQNMVKSDTLTPQQQVIANELADKIYDESLKQSSWDKLKPIYLKAYKDIYTAEEVQAQIDFYSSPTGQSILKKSPIVAQESMKILNTQLKDSISTSEKTFVDIKQKLDQLEKDTSSKN